MEIDCSQMQQTCSSILADIQVSICDESMKRSAAQLDEFQHNKSKKKRRSSLSSHRRSITGNIIPAFHVETESGSQGSSESCSQKASSDDSQPAQSDKTDIQSSRLPNPVNIQLDAIITKMRSQIDSLNEEYKQWSSLLTASKEQEENTKQMALNLLLSVNDIPADVKELAMSKYITSKPLDLCSVKKRLDGLLAQCKFDKEACLQDLQLISETVDTVRSTNEFLNSRLSHIAREAIDESTGDAGTTDSRQTILDYHGCA